MSGARWAVTFGETKRSFSAAAFMNFFGVCSYIGTCENLDSDYVRKEASRFTSVALSASPSIPNSVPSTI